MPTKVFIDGKIADPDDARVSVFDRGFLFGDSVYETMRTAGGVPVDLAPHLERLGRSAGAIALPLPERGVIESAIKATLRAAGNEESSVRVVVTRGTGEIGLATDPDARPSLIVIVRRLVRPDEELYRHGAKLAVVGVQRTPKRAVDPAIKSGNYLNNIMALAEARKVGAHEAVMCDGRGRVAEGSTSNVFAVRGGVVTTPPVDVGLLPGITRSRVLELAAAAGIEVREAMLTPEELQRADEVFITSSVRGVLPISEVDDRHLAAPGPTTRQIMDLYQAHLDAHRPPD